MSRILATLQISDEHKEKLKGKVTELSDLLHEIGAEKGLGVHSAFLQVGEMVEIETMPRDPGLRITYKGEVLVTEFRLPVLVR